MSIDLRPHEKMKSLAREVLKVPGEDFVGYQIFDMVENVLRNKSTQVPTNLSINDKFNLSFNFMEPLKLFEMEISQSPYDIDFDVELGPFEVIEHNNEDELLSSAYDRLKSSSDFLTSLFYYQLICSILVGGINNVFALDDLDYEEYLQPYKALFPKAVVSILQTEYDGVAIKSVPNDLEPLDTSYIPEYLLMDNPHIIYKNGKPYLKLDIMQAITAAGGLAQTLERQDLEGKMTNVGRLSDKKSPTTKSDDSEEDEDTKETK